MHLLKAQSLAAGKRPTTFDLTLSQLVSENCIVDLKQRFIMQNIIGFWSVAAYG